MVIPYLSELSMIEAKDLLIPLVIFVIGMTIYAIFIFKFYRFIARRDIFKLQLYRHDITEFAWLKNLFKIFLYLFEYVLLFPLIIFVWFAFLSILLILLSKGQTINAILISSMALVAVVRITSYYNQELSRDLAKMLPFALLGIFIIDVSFFSPSSSIELAKQIPSVWKNIVYYLLFAIILEFVLRIFYAIFYPMLPDQED